MKLTFRQSARDACSPSTVDSARLLDAVSNGDLRALDFIRRVTDEAIELYAEAVLAQHEGWVKEVDGEA